MISQLHAHIVAEHDFLEALAAIATAFALFVPLPVYVVSTLRQRRADARERAFALIERLDTGPARDLRDRVLAINNRVNLSDASVDDLMSREDIDDLRQFMNENELIGLHLNTSRIDRQIFLSFWRSAYIMEWERFSDYVASLRSRVGPHLYVEWERAVRDARERPH